MSTLEIIVSVLGVLLTILNSMEVWIISDLRDRIVRLENRVMESSQWNGKAGRV